MLHRFQAHPVVSLLARRRLSRTWLATQIPCSPSWLSVVLNGHQPASPRIRRRLSEILELPEAALFHSQENDTSDPTALYVLDVVDAAPCLTEEQRARLAQIFQGFLRSIARAPPEEKRT
jgi:hypothetical protein